jgi:ABC-type molybdate transport system substrate-binding protein
VERRGHEAEDVQPTAGAWRWCIAFNKIGSQFEAANPGVTVTFNYNGSSTLATQITQGAPADVFASASPATMKTVTDAGLAAGTPEMFASNQGEIMVEAGNPSHVTSVSSLASPADANKITDYPIAQVKDAPNAAAAAAFISYVRGSSGQQVLKSFGFLPPPS